MLTGIMQHDSFAMFSRWRPELHPSWGLQMFFILCDISTKTVSPLCFCEIPFPDTDKFCPGYSTYWDFYKKTTYPNPWSGGYFLSCVSIHHWVWIWKPWLRACTCFGYILVLSFVFFWFYCLELDFSLQCSVKSLVLQDSSLGSFWFFALHLYRIWSREPERIIGDRYGMMVSRCRCR